MSLKKTRTGIQDIETGSLTCGELRSPFHKMMRCSKKHRMERVNVVISSI